MGTGRTKSLNKISDTDYLEGTGRRTAGGGDRATEAGVMHAPNGVPDGVRSQGRRVWQRAESEESPSRQRLESGSHQAGSGQSRGDAEPTAWAGVGGGGPLGALGLDGEPAGERQYGTLEMETTYITDHTHDN
jgi:hypothetical protein